MVNNNKNNGRRIQLGDLEDPNYITKLREIGDYILNVNQQLGGNGRMQKISTSVLNKTGNISLVENGGDPEERYKLRIKLHKDLINLDSKYSKIEIHPYNVNRKKSKTYLKHLPLRRLEDPTTGRILADEIDIIDSLLGEYLEKNSSDMILKYGENAGEKRQYVPGKIKEKIIRDIYTIFEENRSELTLKQWIGQRFKDGIPKIRGSPIYNGKETEDLEDRSSDPPEDPQIITCFFPTDGLEGIIMDKLDDIEPDEDGTFKDITTKTRMSREEYFRIISRGHSELVLYLIDPDNYKELLGEEYTLVSADFGMDDLNNIKKGLGIDNDEDLNDKIDDLIEKLEKNELLSNDEEEEAITLVDNWLRCDLIYKSNDPIKGGFLVLEAKQNAYNKKSLLGNGIYEGARKTRQQLDAYMAVILGNIKHYNHMTAKGKNLKKEKVEGIAIAYQMDPDLMTSLNCQSNTSAITIEKDIVKEYISKIFSKHPDLDAPLIDESKVPKDSFWNPIVSSPKDGFKIPTNKQSPALGEKEFRSRIISNGKNEYGLKLEKTEAIKNQILNDPLTNANHDIRFIPYVYVAKDGNAFIVNLDVDRSIKEVFVVDIEDKSTTKMINGLLKSGELGQDSSPNKFFIEKLMDEAKKSGVN